VVSKQAPMRKGFCIFLKPISFLLMILFFFFPFCNASREKLLYIWMMLIFFEVITGLELNFGKSEIVPDGEVGNLDALASILCCKVSIAHDLFGYASLGSL